MIELKTIPQVYAKDIIEDIKNGKIHIVCAAWNGLTHLNVYAELYHKLPKKIVNNSVEIVNQKKETGTFYPQANISILPVSESKKEWNKNPLKTTGEELEACIKDVFLANETYIKAETILFSLEGSYVNKRLAYQIVEKIVGQNNNENLHVKSVWFEQ